MPTSASAATPTLRPARPSGRDRATANVAGPPTTPTKTGTNTRPAGSATPVTSAAAAVAATATAPLMATAARLPRGEKIAVRAQPTANRHRAGWSCTWASSAAMAAPQSRRSAGRIAAAHQPPEASQTPGAVHVPSTRGRRPAPPAVRAALAGAEGAAASSSASTRPGPVSR